MVKLFFIRHCSVNYTKDSTADLAVHLSAMGDTQARELAKTWTRPIAKIYSSPLNRAIETVSPLSKITNTKIIKVSGLRELDYRGNAQEFHKNIKDEVGFKFSGGETIFDANKRFEETLRKVCGKNNNMSIVISTHGTVFSELLIAQFGFSKNFFFKLSYPDVYEINYSNSKFILVKRLKNYLPVSSENLN